MGHQDTRTPPLYSTTCNLRNKVVPSKTSCVAILSMTMALSEQSPEIQLSPRRQSEAFTVPRRVALPRFARKVGLAPLRRIP